MNAHVKCASCFGRGYKGRWRPSKRGRKWSLEVCRACDGRGCKRTCEACAGGSRTMADRKGGAS